MAEEKELKLDKSGYLLANKPNYPRTPSWPYFVWIVFLSMLACTILVWVLSFMFNAPLEEEAAWAKTPNPAKAPWYFIGLQELLVYYDPWIAGVVLPTWIIIGLCMIPYIDISPTRQGYFGWEGRKFAVSFFSFGLFLWFALIVVGQFFRGPSWEFYWPIIDYDIGGHTWTRPGVPLKVSEAKLENMPQMIGVISLFGFFIVGMILPLMIAKMKSSSRWIKMTRDYVNELGMVRYILVQFNVLLTVAVVAKMALRLVFGYKYMITTPWFNI